MEMYGRFYALLALPGVKPSVEGYPADFEERMVKADFTQIAADRDRILKEWSAKFETKSAPKK
jgi:iron(III) transport system substrate-binding protein